MGYNYGNKGKEWELNNAREQNIREKSHFVVKGDAPLFTANGFSFLLPRL